ncbi:MAG: glycosyltransferase family 39 protein [Gaiellaceae bacterium]
MASSAALARPLAVTRAIPVWASLTGIVVVSSLVRFWLGRRMPAPWIMVDELIYSELAKSFAATGHFLVRDTATGGSSYGIVYPLLIAPAYRLFGSVPTAYAVAKGIGAVTMSLACVPAYFLARRVLDRPLALAAALLSVAIPSLLYTGVLLTENAFYPLFLLAALALVAMLERPTARNQLLLLGAVLLAFLTRAQALALVPALVTAVLVVGGWRRFRVLWAVLGGGLVLAVAGEAARGNSPLALLGAYRSTGSAHYSVGSVAKWLLWHVAELDLYLCVAPFAAFLLLAWRRPREPFTAAVVSISVWLALEVAAFASLPSVSWTEERNLFYVAPFFLIALLRVVQDVPRGRAIGVCCAVAGLLPAAFPFRRFIGTKSTADTLAILPWWRLQETWISLGQVRLVATLCALAVAVLVVVLPRRFLLVLPALVLVLLAVQQRPIEARTTFASRGALFQGIRSVPPDWVDRAVGRSANVAVICTGSVDEHVVIENELFNRSVGRVLYTHARLGGNLPDTQETIGRDGYLRDPAGRLERPCYVVVDGLRDPGGRPLARDAALGVALYRLDGPLRSVTRVAGLYPNDSWSGPRVVYTRLGCHGGSVRVGLLGDPSLFRAPQTVRSGGRSLRVAPGVAASFTVPLAGCRAVFAVSPTRVPGAGDPRPLGIHFTSFDYRP